MQEKKQSVRDAWALYQQNPELNAEKLLKVLNDYRETWTNNRKKEQDTLWRQNIAFYAGDHYVRQQSSNASPYRVRIKENHTNNVINRMLSIFVQNLPITRAFSNSTQSDDLKKAETAEAWIKYNWRKKQLERRIIKWIKYSLITGNSFFFRGWDPNMGGQMQLDPVESGKDAPEDAQYQGDLVLQVDDPFRYAVRPGIDEWEDMYDFVRSVPANRSELEAQYGTIEAESSKHLNAVSGEMREDQDTVAQHHYYHKPMPWFPEGLYVCWVGKKILKADAYPFSDGKLPCHHLPFDKSPMKFWAMAPIEQVMDLQEQLDRAASMIVEARNLVARPRWLVSQEAGVPGQAMSDIPGSIIRYKQAGGPPQTVVPSFNFAEMAEHKGDLRNALNQVIGMTSASRGEIPAATRTALALQLVLEQDRSQYLPFIKEIHAGILDLNYGICGLARDFIPEEDPRKIKIEGMTAVRDFSGALIPDPLDLYLEDSNPLGWTAAGRIEQVGFLIDKQIVTDRNQILEMLKLNSPDPAARMLELNKQCQQMENEMLEKGRFVPIGPEDDDAVHLDEVTQVIASFGFKQKPKPVQDAYIQHANEHKARFAQNTAPPPGAGGAPTSGGVDPASMSGALEAPEPGQNMDKLLTSARAG